MIRCGRLCARCTDKHCAEKNELLEIQCPACEGVGCEECQGGHFRFQGCPQVFARPLVPAIRLADIWETKSVFPTQGGTLDQSASFLEFCRRLKAEEVLIEENGKKR